MLDKLTYRRVRLVNDYVLMCQLEAERIAAEAAGDSAREARFSDAESLARPMLQEQVADIRTLEADRTAPLPMRPPSIVWALLRRAGQLAGLTLKRPNRIEKLNQPGGTRR